MKIELLQLNHWTEAKKIYQDGMDAGNATFQTIAPDWQEWNQNHLKSPRLVALQNDLVLGWAALSPISSRPVYSGVAELSIYIGLSQAGKGIGSSLLSHLIEIAESNNIWTIQSSLFPENTGSVQLHNKFGFRKVGYREKIAQHHGIWRDTVIYERRSKLSKF